MYNVEFILLQRTCSVYLRFLKVFYNYLLHSAWLTTNYSRYQYKFKFHNIVLFELVSTAWLMLFSHYNR